MSIRKKTNRKNQQKTASFLLRILIVKAIFPDVRELFCPTIKKK